MTAVTVDQLVAWTRAVVPPSAQDPGGAVPHEVARQLHGILTADHPDWISRYHALAARMQPQESLLHREDADVRWLARLIGQIAAAQPEAWRALRWPAPPADAHEELDVPEEVRACIVPGKSVDTTWDAIVIGSGAGGGVAAQEFAEAGRRVLVIERGGAPPTSMLGRDHLRNPRADARLDVRSGPPIVGNPRVVADGEAVDPSDPRWGNNAFTLGGGTRVYGAQAWRFSPEDFRMATEYGVPAGSALADWPISYAELEPYYAHAEFEWGVAGAPGPAATEGPRSGPFPLPPLPRTRPEAVLKAGADALGWGSQVVPLLINSEPYRGRGACLRCAQCVGFSCPVGAKAGSQNTSLWRAARTARLSIAVETRVTSLTTDAQGRITGVRVRGADADGRWERELKADEVVLAAGAVETARLLLSSRSDREPEGVGNRHDQVGRHLQAHVYAGALAVFADEVNDNLGPGPAIATHEFRHHNAGVVGGGMLANEFVPTPGSALGYLQDAGLVPLGGPELWDSLAHLMPRMQRVMGPVHEVTTADARVTLDDRVTDAWGLPVARLSGEIHDEDRAAAEFLTDRATEWLEASGASTVVPMPVRRRGQGPSVGQHQAGTCRMGVDPSRSVLDPLGRVWGHANLRVVDGSTHVTNGGVNPVLTILANAYRIMDDAVRDSGDGYGG